MRGDRPVIILIGEEHSLSYPIFLAKFLSNRFGGKLFIEGNKINFTRTDTRCGISGRPRYLSESCPIPEVEYCNLQEGSDKLKESFVKTNIDEIVASFPTCDDIFLELVRRNLISVGDSERDALKDHLVKGWGEDFDDKAKLKQKIFSHVFANHSIVSKITSKQREELMLSDLAKDHSDFKIVVVGNSHLQNLARELSGGCKLFVIAINNDLSLANYRLAVDRVRDISLSLCTPELNDNFQRMMSEINTEIGARHPTRIRSVKRVSSSSCCCSIS